MAFVRILTLCARRIRYLFDRRIQVQAAHVQTLGASGSDIREVQHQLNRHGIIYGVWCPITGTYDTTTRDAVRIFQLCALGIESDGFIGPLTARRLRIVLIDD